mgnify:CR=1 FL=1
MAAPRSRTDDQLDDASPAATESVLSIADAPAPEPLPHVPTIQDVMDVAAAYLLTQYVDSLTDQEAVLDAARMLADGHMVPAWRQLARMMDQVLNVPPGG